MGEDNETRAAANAPTADANTAQTEMAESDADALPFELPPPGYQLGGLIGKGGMGEVIAAHDQRIGREVAFKRMRAVHASGESLARFLREARIQARLDHPAIVPVYELGKDAEGRPYFTMKRLAGKTLTQHLVDKDTQRSRLLRAFAEICLAIELAHSRGVIHRDLKPSNIMLGDFGEVYVLDWGVARVLGGKRQPTGGVQSDDIDSVDGQQTMTGDMLGTPGYMAPEQMRGEESIGPAADVYALGAILFEILASEPLHPRGHAAVASTLTMEEASPAQLHPDRNIPLELDAACSAALVADPAKRPSARELGERVERYVDGDRDTERRRALAVEAVSAAREALASGKPERRAEAMRAAGRALGLDPESKDAAELVSTFIVEPPNDPPAELVAELAASDSESAKVRGRKAITAVGSLLSLSFLLLFLDIKNLPWLVVIYATFGAVLTILWRTYKTGRIYPALLATYALVLSVAFSRVAGPLILLPVLMCGTILPLSNIPKLNDRPFLLYVWVFVIALLPSALEMTGLLAPTMTSTTDHIEMRSAIFVHSSTIGLNAMVFGNAVLLIAVARFSLAIGRDRRDVQRKLTNQAWHLKKLLP